MVGIFLINPCNIFSKMRNFNSSNVLCLFLPNRIDGMLLNITSNYSKPIDINNGTVLLDRQRRFTSEAEENSIALISLQYNSGKYATLSSLIGLHANNRRSSLVNRSVWTTSLYQC